MGFAHVFVWLKSDDPAILIPLIVAVPLPPTLTVIACGALWTPSTVPGTPNDNLLLLGETVTVCPSASSTARLARQQIAATRVIERTITFHAIIFFLLEALIRVTDVQMFLLCGLLGVFG
jgi:hypothetical protein